jgi:hypothetical protein
MRKAIFGGLLFVGGCILLAGCLIAPNAEDSIAWMGISFMFAGLVIGAFGLRKNS